VSERLEARGEAIKLARLLGAPPAELEFVEKLPASVLREYREAATERLFAADAALFRRVAAAARILPSALIANVAQRAFGPLLCARAAGSVDTDKALDVLKRLPPEFVADATVEVDPRRVAELIAAVPEDLVVPVARILGEHSEYVTMGRFLAYVPDHAIASAIGALSDEALLRTAFVLEHKDRLDHAIGMLPDQRLPGLITHASDLQLWPEALDLMGHLSAERLGPIADAVAHQDAEVLGDLVAAVSEAGIWDSLLPVVRLMSEQSLARLVTVAPFHDRTTLAEIMTTVADSEDGLWRDLAPLVQALPPEVRATAASIAGDLTPLQLERILHDAAATPEAVAPLVSLIAAMDERAQRKVSDVVGAVGGDDPDALREVIGAAARNMLWSELAPLLRIASTDTLTAIARAASELDDVETALLIEQAAAAPRAIPQLVAVIELMPPESHERLARILERTPQQVVRPMYDALSDPSHDGLLERLPSPVRAVAEETEASS
jgi:hypothetical protein